VLLVIVLLLNFVPVIRATNQNFHRASSQNSNSFCLTFGTYALCFAGIKLQVLVTELLRLSTRNRSLMEIKIYWINLSCLSKVLQCRAN